MEKAYFDLRHRYPGREEYAYFRLALRSRYLEKSEDYIKQLVSACLSLDDAIFHAIGEDFGRDAALQVAMHVLWRFPACSRCGKYKAFSTTDDLCYGCREYPDFAACTNCRLYWDNYPQVRFCQHCGGELWRITDGPQSEDPNPVTS